MDLVFDNVNQISSRPTLKMLTWNSRSHHPEECNADDRYHAGDDHQNGDAHHGSRRDRKEKREEVNQRYWGEAIQGEDEDDDRPVRCQFLNWDEGEHELYGYWVGLCNVFTQTRNAVDSCAHGREKEQADTWTNTNGERVGNN